MSGRLRDRELHHRFVFQRLGFIEFVAGAASRFVRRIAHFHLRVSARHALRVMRGAAAAHANGMHLRDFLRDREERRHRTERPPHVILIETGSDDPNAGISELHADFDDAGIEGEIAVREVRTGRVEVVQELLWGRPESVRQEFRKLRAQ